jgi:uncharacterized protein YlxW (UPF0749 family)
MLRRGFLSRLCLAAVLLGLGVATVAQLRTQRNLQKTRYDEDEQVVLLSELVEANYRLRTEIASLSAQLAASGTERSGTMLEELVTDLNRVRMFNGVTVAAGPGVEVVLNGPLNALDLQDIVNELRNAGAEAISLNGVRLTLDSAVSVNQAGELSLDGQAIRRPFRLEAIGDGQTIETAILRRGGLVSLLERSYPGLSVQTTQRKWLVLEASRRPVALRHAEMAQ